MLLNITTVIYICLKLWCQIPSYQNLTSFSLMIIWKSDSNDVFSQTLCSSLLIMAVSFFPNNLVMLLIENIVIRNRMKTTALGLLRTDTVERGYDYLKLY